MITPLFEMPGGWELIIIVLVVVLLFGAKKLPELARGSGQALRIFKDETKGLTSGDEAKDAADVTEMKAEPEPEPERRSDGTSA
ncbi:MAG: twin-arginine translocase TatA/TatE family subunit [Nocardioides sp.]|uniref:twin-arginine translocase TatA/TatE family subunit n=1 Tax=Nocardioides sp. TaxID=35761 RepID=UPI0039E6E515